MTDSDPIAPTPTGCRIRVRAQPRASRSELAGRHGDALKVRLAAPPVDGLANEELERYLAERLGTARRHVRVTRGTAGRDKLVAVDGIGVEAARRALGI